jgi:hypothetical protein
MSGETEVQAPPWAGLTWAEYHAQVMTLSAYPAEHRQLCAQAGMIAEMGELLSLFDLRRVAKKGLPAREAVRAELGDVLWYAALHSRSPGVFEWWADRIPRGCELYAEGDRSAVNYTMEIVGVARAVGGDNELLCGWAGFLCRRLGLSAQEVAFYNLEKLRARQSAGTLHDREARVPGGGV